MRGIWLLFKKEILEALRDRRTAILVVVFPLIFYPMMLGLIFHFTTQNIPDGEPTRSRIIYLNRGAEPVLADFFTREENMEVFFYEDRGSAVEAFEQHGDIMLEVMEKEPSGVNVEISHREYDQASEIALSRSRGVLESYLQEDLKQRLGGMDISYEEIAPPLEVEVLSVGDAEAALGRNMLQMMLPYFVVLSIITAAMGLGAEITAGEKERKTISTLLVSRLSREEIVLGKFFAVFSVGCVAAVFSVAGLVYGLRLFGIGLPLEALTPGVFASMLLTLLPLVAVLSSLVIIIGSFARTQKEANIYQTPVLMLVVLVGLLSMVEGFRLGDYAFFVPLLNSLETFKELILGTIDLFHIGMTFLTMVPLAVVFIYLSVLLFRKEDILFRL